MSAATRIIGPVLAAALLTSTVARAGIENAGTTAANFLSLGAGASTLAMGGAGLGLGDDAAGVAWNAAALGWIDGADAALSHAALPNNSTQEWGTIGAQVRQTGLRWGLTGLYQGDGSFQGLDASGTPIGNFSVSSVAAGATVAHVFAGVASIGVGAKAVHEGVATATGTGFTFDAGLMVRAGAFGIGLAAQNVGGQMRYGPVRYPFPTNYGVGLGYRHPGAAVRVAVDANFPNAYHPDLRAGVEWLYRGALALRGGYRMELGSSADPLTGPTFGLGARAGSMWLDYGYLLAGEGSGQHRMGLRFHFGAGASPQKTASGPKAPKPERPGDFDWARDAGKLSPGKSSKP